MTKADQLPGNGTRWLAESVNHGARLPGFKSLLHQGLNFSLLPFPILWYGKNVKHWPYRINGECQEMKTSRRQRAAPDLQGCLVVEVRWGMETPTQNSHWKNNAQNPMIQIESQGTGFQAYLLKSAHRVCCSHVPLLSGTSISTSPLASWFLLAPQPGGIRIFLLVYLSGYTQAGDGQWCEPGSLQRSRVISKWVPKPCLLSEAMTWHTQALLQIGLSRRLVLPNPANLRDSVTSLLSIILQLSRPELFPSFVTLEGSIQLDYTLSWRCILESGPWTQRRFLVFLIPLIWKCHHHEEPRLGLYPLPRPLPGRHFFKSST